MSKMTSEQLKGFVLEVLKSDVSATVADVVKEQMAKAMEKNQAQTPIDRAFQPGDVTMTEDGGFKMTMDQWLSFTKWQGATSYHGITARPPDHLGLKFGSCMRAYANARNAGTGISGAVDIMKRWDKDVAKAWEKALSASDATGGGFLVPPQYSQEIIEFLRPASVIRKLGPMMVPMPTGTIRIPKVTSGASASYIGENVNLPKSQQQFGQVTLTFKKEGVLVPISNDLIRYSSPGADAIVRDDLVRAMAQAESNAMLRGDGISGPKGMLNWCLDANKVNANGTVSLANVTIDLGKLIVSLMNNNIPMTKPVWIWAPRTWNYLMTVQTANGQFPYRDELMRGTFWGWAYGTTTQVPINNAEVGTAESEVYLADFADFALGESQSLIVDASQEAAYHDGTNVVAAFSQDQTVIRCIAEHDFVARRQESVAMLKRVNWGT